eukprot:scaffold129257_cov54-Attheya_sp.AAC.5
MALPASEASLPSSSSDPAPPPSVISSATNRTSAHREGGKFGGGERGKFAKLSAAAAAPAPPTSSSSTADAEAQAQAQAQQSLTKERRIKQSKLWQDLNRAEDLVLELVTLAAGTSHILNDLTLPQQHDDDDDDVTKKEEEARQNGTKYTQALSQIHSLLTPHAHLVVAYTTNTTTGTPLGPPTSVQSAPPTTETIGTTTTNTKAPTNMYASRVEMRLAMEKQSVLEELLRLEQQDLKQEDSPEMSQTVLEKKRPLDIN